MRLDSGPWQLPEKCDSDQPLASITWFKRLFPAYHECVVIANQSIANQSRPPTCVDARKTSRTDIVDYFSSDYYGAIGLCGRMSLRESGHQPVDVM
jgi:hypothetical protein